MTVSLTLAKATPYSLDYLLTHDGQAGDAVVVPAATMIADLVAAQAQGPLLQMLSGGANPNSQALARQHMQGDGSAAAQTAMVNVPHAEAQVDPRTGPAYVLDADVDGVTATRWEYNATAAATAAGVAILKIRFVHSYAR